MKPCERHRNIPQCIDLSIGATQAAQDQTAHEFLIRCRSYEQLMQKAKAERAAAVTAMLRSVAAWLISVFRAPLPDPSARPDKSPARSNADRAAGKVSGVHA